MFFLSTFLFIITQKIFWFFVICICVAIVWRMLTQEHPNSFSARDWSPRRAPLYHRFAFEKDLPSPSLLPFFAEHCLIQSNTLHNHLDTARSKRENKKEVEVSMSTMRRLQLLMKKKKLNAKSQSFYCMMILSRTACNRLRPRSSRNFRCQRSICICCT